MVTRPPGQNDIDQLIADEFGVNADYVLELLQQFERAPDSIDAEWRSFFNELLSNGNLATDRSAVPAQATSSEPAQSASPRESSGSARSGVAESPYQWGAEVAP